MAFKMKGFSAFTKTEKENIKEAWNSASNINYSDAFNAILKTRAKLMGLTVDEYSVKIK